MSVMEINSFNYLIRHDFEKAKENKLAIGVFVKNEESYLKEVSVANPLNKLRWANHIKIREITKYVKKRIKEGIALQGIDNLWIDRNNLALKRQYAFLNRMDPSFSNPLKETLIIHIRVPFVDENSSVKNPKHIWREALRIKFDELTKVEHIADKVRRAFFILNTKTFGREISFNCKSLRLSDSAISLHAALMNYEGTLADFLRSRELNNELRIRYEGFNIPQLIKNLEIQAEKDGSRHGKLCGKKKNPKPPHPDLSPEEAAKLSFGLDCYYKSYEKAFYQGFEKGKASKHSQKQVKKESCAQILNRANEDTIIDRQGEKKGCAPAPNRGNKYNVIDEKTSFISCQTERSSSLSEIDECVSPFNSVFTTKV